MLLFGSLQLKKSDTSLTNTRDASRATDEDDFENVRLVDLEVAKGILDRFQRRAERGLAKLFETCTGERGVEVNALEGESISIEV